MVLKRMMNASLVVRKILLITLFLTIYLSVFVNKVLSKYRIESFSQQLRKNAPRKSVQAYR